MKQICIYIKFLSFFLSKGWDYYNLLMASNRGFFGAPPPPRGGSAGASRRVDNRENLLTALVTQHRSLLLPSSIGLMDINNIIGLGEIGSFTFLHFTNNKNDVQDCPLFDHLPSLGCKLA